MQVHPGRHARDARGRPQRDRADSRQPAAHALQERIERPGRREVAPGRGVGRAVEGDVRERGCDSDRRPDVTVRVGRRDRARRRRRSRQEDSRRVGERPGDSSATRAPRSIDSARGTRRPARAASSPPRAAPPPTRPPRGFLDAGQAPLEEEDEERAGQREGEEEARAAGGPPARRRGSRRRQRDRTRWSWRWTSIVAPAARRGAAARLYS